MHPAPSLSEAPPKTDEARSGKTRPLSPGSAAADHRTPSASPPMRKDTTSSISTTATNASAATITSAETADTSYNGELSPSYATQGVFSVKDGADVANSRRTSRRRTGPLSAAQREKAALIRKLGACNDCRRRRVACHPSHHNMTWEDAVRKYKTHSPTMELAPLAGRPLSPAPLGVRPNFTHDPQDMDIDATPTPTQPPASQTAPRLPQPALSEARLRTPLPSGRSLEKLASAALPSIEHLTNDLQGTVSRAISQASSSRSRYTSVQVMMLLWREEADADVRVAVDELVGVFEKQYHYGLRFEYIQPTDSAFFPLSRAVTNFVEDSDPRNTLKIVYYIGHSYLDGNREMVLASSADRGLAHTIRWSGIQQILENASSDTLILMDAAYYPSSRMVRQTGVLELVAASVAEDHARTLGRGTFTRALTKELQTRASQKFRSPFSAAELHAKLLCSYPQLIQDRNPEKEMLTSFPSPLHIQMSGNSRLPSIVLAPSRRALPSGSDSDPPGPLVNLTVRLNSDVIDEASWIEWLRLLPEGVKEVKCESPYRNTFR